jgi:hypothetical protein
VSAGDASTFWRKSRKHTFSSDCAYEAWHKVAAALHNERGEFGFELFDQWSAKATGDAELAIAEHGDKPATQAVSPLVKGVVKDDFDRHAGLVLAPFAGEVRPAKVRALAMTPDRSLRSKK